MEVAIMSSELPAWELEFRFEGGLLPLAFTATETFEVGRDQGSPVSRQYFDRAPFPFEGVIHDVRVDYPGSQTSHPKHSGDHHVL